MVGNVISPLCTSIFLSALCKEGRAGSLPYKSESLFTLDTRVVRRQEHGRDDYWRLRALVRRKVVEGVSKRLLGSPLIILHGSRTGHSY